LQFAYLVSLYHHYHLLQQEHGKLEALELFSLAHRYSWIICCQTLVAVTQAMAEKRQAIFEEELRAIEGGRKPVSEEELQAIAKDRPLTPQEVARAVAEERSRCCMVRISTFVEQRPPLGFLGLECLQMGSMTIAHFH